MTSVSPEILLEVTVASERDVAGAQEGGATRLHVTAGLVRSWRLLADDAAERL